MKNIISFVFFVRLNDKTPRYIAISILTIMVKTATIGRLSPNFLFFMAYNPTNKLKWR